MTRVKPAPITPATTRQRRLPKALKQLRLGWGSKGLPADARATLYDVAKKGVLGKKLAGLLAVNGSFSIPVTKLRVGANYLHVLVTRAGVAIDDLPFAAVVWR